MTHTYNISGMTCGGCAASVKSALLRHPDVLAADIDLDHHQAIVSMSRHLTAHDLQQAIGNTKYHVSEGVHSQVEMQVTRSWIETYRPILLIFALIMSVALSTSWTSEGVSWMNFMNTFMAGFFLVFSFFKLLDLKSFAASYAMYDVVAMKVKSYGYIYPFIELSLGFAYLTGINLFITNVITLGVMGISSVGVIASVINKKKIQCACLGAVFNLPMSTVTIVEDALMVGMAGLMLVIN